MTSKTYVTDDLAREIDILGSSQPHLQNILNAFGPFLLEKNQWLSDTAVDAKALSIDPLRYVQGISLNRQQNVFSTDDPWGSAGWSAAKAIAQGFPKFAPDMDVLLRRFTEGNYDCITHLFADAQEVDVDLTEKSKELAISPTSLHLFLRLLNRFMLTKKARDMHGELTAHGWAKGYCPVCGSMPHLAILGDNGQRHLQCPDCNHQWKFARLTCPYCEHEDAANTESIFIEGKKEESAFVCSKCRKYLLTVNRSESLQQLPADLLALGLIHLDVILQEKGLCTDGRMRMEQLYGHGKMKFLPGLCKIAYPGK